MGHRYCPKCFRLSGDDWKQCEGKCPVKDSPHFDQQTFEQYGGLRESSVQEKSKTGHHSG